MFEQTFVNTRVETRKPAAVAASLVFQSAAIGSLLLIPLLHPELLPLPKLEGPVVWMVPIQPPAPPPDRPVVKRRIPRESGLFSPIGIPKTIAMVVDEPDFAGDAAMPALAPAMDRFASLLPPVVPPPPPQPVKPIEIIPPPRQIGVSQGVQAAKLIFGPKPQYPPLARAARVQGTIRLRAIIGTDGNVRNLQVLSGPALLIKAALDAVGQWRYQPTLLSGAPVEVTTQIDVTFTLSR